ncbi:hypothetical protein PsYK624_163290 [Phanerochaete sordida]|uniref:Uncharacterized protein n=1 Tax=Phanerochaete sordida TaxID=48140 RepID=A0A9P3GSJ6_9APHY|nr:hypothetical protein PsYK624_163290 [Phanerochaete sordida]
MVLIPRGSNPHALQQTTQIVSRADLEAEHNVPHAEHKDDDRDVVKALERMLKRSLGDFQLGQAEVEHTDERHKKRRRKSKTGASEEAAAAAGPEEQTKEAEIVEFRLLSKSTKAVSLKPKPAPKIIAVEPSWEDDDREAALRAERARATAVDASWVFAESKKTYHTSPNADRKVISLTLDQPLHTAEVVIFEVPRPLPTSKAPSPLNAPSKERPSPHAFPPEKLSCPVISAAVLDAEAPPHQRKRKPRHKNKPIEPRPPASFWRPQREWGGKSLGYAMGYEGSRPIPTGSVRQWRYRRDTMKKAVFVV